MLCQLSESYFRLREGGLEENFLTKKASSGTACLK
ncbi:unnamed protein product [Arabidopsis halleri]